MSGAPPGAVCGPPSPPGLHAVRAPAAATERSDREARNVSTRLYGLDAASVPDSLARQLLAAAFTVPDLRDVARAPRPAAGRARVLEVVPSHLPAYGYVSSPFGTRISPFTGRRVHHNGVDIAVPYGAPIYAAAAGVVTFAGWAHGFGRFIVVDHGSGVETKYGHNSRLTRRVGDRVRRGEVIAKAGSTGRSTGVHVHYEVWIGGRAVDPQRFLNDTPDRDGAATRVAVAPVDAPDRDDPHAMGGEDGAGDEP